MNNQSIEEASENKVVLNHLKLMTGEFNVL